MKHIILTALLGLIFFSGCGKNPEKTNVVFSYGKVSAAEERVLNDLIKEFEDKNPQIDVVLQELPSNPTLQYKYYLESFEQKLHEPPDIMCLDIMLFPQLAAKDGWLSFIEWYFKEKNKFLPGAVKGCIYQHGIYAIPWSVDGGVLYYRKDLLKKHGFSSPPKTFNELINQANAIIPAEKCSGFIWPGKNSEDMVCTFLEFLWGNDGILLAGSEVLVNSLWGREALQMMTDLIYKHGISPQSVLAMDDTVAINTFISGNAVFLRGWSHSGQSMFSNPSLKDKIGIAPMPCFIDNEKKSASCLQAEVLSINKHSKCEKEAWLLIEFLTSEYVQKKRLISINKNPSRIGLYNDIQLQKNMPIISEFYPAFIQFQPRPITLHYPEISLVMQGCIRDVLMQKSTPEESFKKTTEDIGKVFLPQ
ncbi:MAG: extracellular solute-binding protein [bacterium]|nr:extracellular solute-binding protein [bacterium]